MKEEVGFIGLGKMGMHMAARLCKKGWKVVGFDADQKISEVSSLQELVNHLTPPRLVWIMVPAGKPVDDVLRKITSFLNRGDTVIEGGNSYYKDSVRRAKKLKGKGIRFLDVGVSGGPVSIKIGKFAIMVGGERGIYEKCKDVFGDLSDTPSVYMGRSGAGHFTKMIHNGIEYGMMQALAEGFTILKKSPLHISLKNAARAYQSNSIITSRLVDWLMESFEMYGEDLEKASGTVARTGEGEWTVKTAREFGVQVPIIKGALAFRVQSKKKPNYTGKVLSSLRAVFGGHSVR